MPNGIFTLKQQVLGLKQSAWTGQKTPAVDYLVVAGGGGGGRNWGGGAGGGGLLQGNIPVALNTSITVTIGGGGTGATSDTSPNGATNGSNSVFGSITATGGGLGGSYNNQNAGSGGSGGGAGSGSTPGILGQGTAGQGNAGGQGDNNSGSNNAGGGGGAGTVGGNSSGQSGQWGSGNGGQGASSDISGTRTTYAGGGGGSSNSGGIAGLGGAGGGGNGGFYGTSNPTAGTANTGGGGGGGQYTVNGGNGGSGIVIISYPDTYAAAASTTGSPTVTTSGSGSIAFNGSSYFVYNNQTQFSFGTGDFTFELWVYATSLSSNPSLIDWRPNGVNGAYPYLVILSDGTLIYYVNSANAVASSAGAISINNWYHIAVARSGTSTKMFLNGTQVSSTYSDSNNYGVGTSRPSVAASGGSPGAGPLSGYISNLRVVKGTAVYTANFTVPAAPLSSIANTSLLLSSVSGAYLADNSANSFTPSTVTGTPSWNSSSPFATGLGYKNRVYQWTSSGSITF